VVLYFHSPVYVLPAAKPVAKDEHGALGFQCRFIYVHMFICVYDTPLYICVCVCLQGGADKSLARPTS
jgi:hypothetical protein